MLFADFASLLSQLLAFAQANGILSGTVVVAIIGGLYKIFRDWRDSSAVISFLEESSTSSGYRFRSSEAISAATKISKSRVERLCIKHKRISRNGAEKESWQLTA